MTPTGPFIEMGSELEIVNRQIRKMEAENVELRKDKARLDWLEKLGIFDIFHSSYNLRAEIDRQMEKP